MTPIFTIIASLAASVAAYATFKTMLQGMELKTMQDNIVQNPCNHVITILKIYTRKGTFSSLERDTEGRGHIVDSGKSVIPINLTLFSQETYTIPYKYIFIDGKKYGYYAMPRHDFSRGLSFRNYKIEAVPRLPA